MSCIDTGSRSRSALQRGDRRAGIASWLAPRRAGWASPPRRPRRLRSAIAPRSAGSRNRGPHQQLGADCLRVLEQALRRLRIADDGRPAGAEDAGLLEADRLARVPR
jgi:hypothetical protein